MPFVPAASVTSIKTVTDSVPSLTRDAWYWPCMAGEPFPPAFASGAGYSTALGKPCVGVGQVGAASTWPSLPRVSYTGKATVTLSAALNMYVTINATTDNVFGFLNIATFGWKGGGVAGTARAYNPAGTPIGTAALPAQTWNGFVILKIVLTPTATIFQIDDVTVATLGAVPANGALLTPKGTAGTNYAGDFSIAQLAVDYAA